MNKYYPVMISRNGEIRALTHLEDSVKQSITPIIEVIPKSFQTKEKSKGNEDSLSHLEKFLSNHWSFKGNRIILDFSLLEISSDILFKIKKLLNISTQNGVNLIPVIYSGTPNNLFTTFKTI